ncbi:MAG: hypothetical protein AB1348_07480 [Nitrospirota bacterium]
MSKKKVIAFDLEGPLSPMDHAVEVLGLAPQGRNLFAVLSRYDDLLTLEGKASYEPGDTLILILPFLLFHQIKEKDLIRVSERATIVGGAKEIISQLKKDGWDVYIISTSYCQHAISIGSRLGIERNNIYCTYLNPDSLDRNLNEETASLLKETEDFILLNLYSESLDSGEKDSIIKPYLDKFFWGDLGRTPLGLLMEGTKVMGGRRKRDALIEIAEKTGTPLSDMVVVGDSITDLHMLRAVEEAGGLAIVFNGNKFSLPYGTASVASTDLRDIRLLTDKWLENRRESVKQAILRLTTYDSRLTTADGPYYHWLDGLYEKEINEILQIHKRFRQAVRGEATARLG